ncbi:3-hydroxyacyl-CoA dehydrogenase NAD-binding domain-containing protein [Bordetella genomosp. 5]|uniref:Enoyl-CoA hydratase n=1 Tax=Bordetella genomosp. 5 TaxID=1395608 RepID=A0A261TAY5_9BORD|nr:3-hydroxyacyl-CoA dehydrogenase NAD-binding domain-containing protein [Bordetella genomosp. 5]OZI46565.1 enoyl-CoA hydratase [Bordetella genomosp. 5]
MNTQAPLWQHWQLRRDADGLAWLTIDRAGSKVNALSADVLREFNQVLDALQADRPQGLVIRSGKSTGFILGADIDEFGDVRSADDAQALVERGWTTFNRLARAPYPTLALIEGNCLGGGLELALACRYRLVADTPDTALALPEVMLGIFPAWGGMQRLPALIGAPAALDMMLTGRRIDARRAAALGLADARVPVRLLDAAARQQVLSGRARRRARGIGGLLNWRPLRGLVAARARKQVQAKDPLGHYPAPLAIIDTWEKHNGDPLRAREQTARLVQSDTARNLVRVFRLQERLKGVARGEPAVPIRHVHVVGAGVMGGDIAAWCAYKGMSVTLQDRDTALIAPALGRAATLYARRLKDKRAARAALDRLTPDPEGRGVARADLVIEAISEREEVKEALYRSLEPRLKPGALLATNTSSLSLARLRSVLQRPERLVGIHFFNPVAKMPLVEIVTCPGDTPEAGQRAAAFVAQLGKLPLPVHDAPGFLVNAVLAPYLLEAMRCVDEGIAPATIDAALTAFGMPMGPLELADTVGLDIVLDAGKQLTQQAEPPRCLRERTARGDLGKKTGAGFYRWQNGRAQKGQAGTPPTGLAERLVTPLIERTARQVADGVVADADLADAGVIFGTGFAPFTGGPLHYRDNQGGRVRPPGPIEPTLSPNATFTETGRSDP